MPRLSRRVAEFNQDQRNRVVRVLKMGGHNTMVTKTITKSDTYGRAVAPGPRGTF